MVALFRLLVVAFILLNFPKVARAEQDPEENPDYHAPKGSLPSDGVTYEDPPTKAPLKSRATTQPIDWNKKLLITTTGAAAFAIGYGFALDRAAVPPPTGGLYNGVLRVPFAGPVLYGSRFVSAILHTPRDPKDFSTSPGWIGTSAVAEALVYALDTVLQVGGAIAVVYGVAAPLRKSPTSAKSDLHVSPILGFDNVGLAGTF